MRLSIEGLIGWNKEKTLAIDDGIELGNVYSGGDDDIIDSNNPMHGVKIRKPSAVPLPPLDWDGYNKKEYKGAKKQKLKELADMSKYLRSVSGGEKVADGVAVCNE